MSKSLRGKITGCVSRFGKCIVQESSMADTKVIKGAIRCPIHSCHYFPSKRLQIAARWRILRLE